MDVYLVCEGTGGGHESSGVFSVWTDHRAAISEAARLAARFPDAHIEIVYTTIGRSRDEADVTWAPPDWRDIAAGQP